PYKWGTNKLRGDSTFDCSNFTQYVYETALGYRFSSGAKNQGDLNQYQDWGVYYRIRDIRAGDLLFFSTSTSGGKVGHVGIALEDGTLKIIHTYSSKVPLGEYDYTNSKWWTSHFLYARRPLNHLAGTSPGNGTSGGSGTVPPAPSSDGGQDGPTERAVSSGQRVTPVSGWVSVYQDASTSSPRIAVLRPGESASVLEKVNAWWYKIRLSGGAVGYITSSPRYVRVE
ncbi:MAG: C40 family peptidase, partial [Alicyclobacillaceae bacterium]|nr:C40 family peptidase [Alicyclobacillaceae bacterium]